MKIRRRATLVCTFEGKHTAVHEFLNRKMYECNAAALQLLAGLDEWTEMDSALQLPPGPLENNGKLIRQLLENELILIEGSSEAERDQHYRDTWRWGSVAGFYHFSLRDSKFITGEAAVEKLKSYGGPKTSPPLMSTNEGLERIENLPEFPQDDAFFNVLHRRRSQREFGNSPISQQQLGDCLFAGNGLTEILDAGEFGRLPLTMTPSGGARNPFELYVQIRNVEGLQPGIYHYSGAEHSLGFLHDKDLPDPSEILAEQEWTSNAAAIVFLCAEFERPAWKYRQALAYRVILMEVGAITQNIQLAATRHGIRSAPTGAISESRIEAMLGLPEIEQAALFAIAIGQPA